MKAWKLAAGLLLAFLAAESELQAQLLSESGVTSSTAPDSTVQMTAELQGLTLMLPEAVPMSGTFWIVTADGVTAPSPCLPPSCEGLPVYAITSNVFLVDASGGQVDLQGLGATTTTEALEILASEVENIITQTQTGAANRRTQAVNASVQTMSAGAMAADDNGGGNLALAFDFPTNSLWLEITGIVSDGTVSFNLHNATDQVYAVSSTTNLSTPLTNWQVEAEVWPTNGAVTPWTVAMLNRDTLFLRAEDWTGVTANGNQIPCWWFWEYFGTLNLSDTNVDGSGNTLLSDYENNSDPTVINFTIQVANNYVNNMSVPMELAVQGVPYYQAVLVDDTNLADAVWTPYTSSSLTVNLGLTEGWHNVWIGLKAYSTNAYVAWVGKRLKLDLTPPWLVITNPATNTVSQPMIELQGYSAEPLANISYDLTNALGLVTNQQVLVLSQFYDTNVWDYTTNTFQAFDVPLTNGLNVITVHATDLAGNVMTTNFSFTLDYSSKTNPPTVQLYWPQDGTWICNNSFTWRGWISDFTATVTAQMVDTNGNTNIFDGIVERNGNFWIENLPVNAGTNAWTLTVTDVVGNVATTNIAVYPGNVGLTIAPLDSNHLWNPTITVTGTIADTNDYTVWVNGRKATFEGYGNWWIATNVPLPSGGTAVIQARAIPNSNDGGNGTGGSGGGPVSYDNLGNPDPAEDQDMEIAPDRPTRLYMATYFQNWEDNLQIQSSAQGAEGTSWTDQKQENYDYQELWVDDGPGSPGVGSGTTTYNDDETWSGCDGNDSSSDTAQDQVTEPGGMEVYTIDGISGTNYGVVLPVISEHCIVAPSESRTGPLPGPAPNCVISPASTSWQRQENFQREAQATWILETGGKGVPGQENLWEISGSATEDTLGPSDLIADPPYSGASTASIPPQDITILGRPLGSDGNLWTTLPAGATKDVTPQASGYDYYTFGVGAGECILTAPSLSPHQGVLVTTNPVPTYLVSYCEGSYVTVSANPPCDINVVLPNEWQMTGGLAYPGDNTKRLVDRSQIGSTTVTATAAGQTSTIKIIVYQAKFEIDGDVGDCGFDVGHAWWNLSVQPSDVYPFLKKADGTDLSKRLGTAGYYDHCLPQGPGQVIFGTQINQCGDQSPHQTSCSYWWCTSWADLETALGYVDNLAKNPGTYTVCVDDCVTEAINVGSLAGVTLNVGGSCTSPCDLCSYLDANWYPIPETCQCR